MTSFCLFQSVVFTIAVLIDAIVKNGSAASAGADYMPPPPGWRDEDIGSSETTFSTSSDEKKTYTEEQRQGVARCNTFILFHLTRCTASIIIIIIINKRGMVFSWSLL